MYLPIDNSEILRGLLNCALVLVVLWITVWLIIAKIRVEQSLISSQSKSKGVTRDYVKELEKTQRMAQVGSWHWNIKTGQIWWSDEMYRIAGLSREDLGHSSHELFSEILHPDDREFVLRDREQILETGKAHDIEYRIIRSDGSVRVMYSWRDVITDVNGNVIALEGTIQDITERKLVESRTEELRKAMENSVDAIMLGNEDAEIYYVNKSACDEYGYSFEEFTSLSIFDIDPITDTQGIQESKNQLINERFTIERQHKRKDGSIFPVEVSSITLESEGKPYYCAFVRNITDRKLETKKMEELMFAIDNAIDAVYLTRTNGDIFYVNQGACRQLGYSYNELISMNAGDIDPTLTPEKRAFVRQNEDAGEIQTFETTHRRKDGTTFPVEMVFNYSSFEGNAFSVAFVRDIAERKRTARQTGELRFAVENAEDAIYLNDKDGNIYFVNKSATQQLGYSYDELTSMNINDIDANYSPEHLQKIIGEGQDSVTPLDNPRHRRKDGSTFPVEVTFNSREFDGIEYYCSFVRDVTDQKQAQEALRKSEEKFSKAVNASPESVVITRCRDGMFLFVNPGYTKLLGFTEQETIGKTSKELNIWADTDEREQFVEKLKQDGQLKNFETRNRTKSGDIIPVSISASLIDFEAEECMVCWGRDLSQDKKDEQEKRHMQQQLFRSQKLDAIGQLTGGVAHDFNNILASILGYNSLAMKRCEKMDDVKQLGYLKEVRHGGQRAKQLIEQMLMYSRDLPGETSRQSLPPLVENIMRLLRPTLPSSIDIQLQLPEDVPDILIDPAQFEQIIMNLCINARDAIEGSGYIGIDLYQDSLVRRECASCHEMVSGDYVILSVQDSGTGMSAEVSALVFDPFYTTKEVGKGTGMGLSMVHGIMHNCDGHVLLDSIPGQGTTFSLLYPVLEECTQITESPVREDPVELDRGEKQGVIMIVDDEPAIAGYLGELLKENGYEVKVMTCSEKALTVFKGAVEEIDLILTDQTMPGLTGLELAGEVLKLRPDIPIILSTGYSELVDDKKAREAGIKVYLKKPVDETVLLNSINGLIVQSQVSAIDN